MNSENNIEEALENENGNGTEKENIQRAIIKKFTFNNLLARKVHPLNPENPNPDSPDQVSPESGDEATPIFQKALTFNMHNSVADSMTLKLNLIKSLILVSFELMFDYLGVINIILMTYCRLEYLHEKYNDICFSIEIAVLLFFIFEFLNYLRYLRWKSFSFTLSFHLTCNLLMIFQIIYMLNQHPFNPRSVDASILINVIRSFRIYSIKKFFVQVKKVLSPRDGDVNETMQMGYFILLNMVYLGSAMFIEATFFIAVDALENYNGYAKHDINEFEYVSALYFSTQTLTTIGYGDIFATTPSTRILQFFVLFINLCSVSFFLSKLTDVIYLISPYIKQYSFKNHLVVVGGLPATFLRYFLLEVQECDKIQRNLLTYYGKRPKLEHVLIIDRKKPSAELEMILEDQSFEFEINYLMDNMLTKEWCILSNLKHAKHLFIFNIEHTETEAQNIQRDLSTLALARRVEMDYNKELTMTLVLSTDAHENFTSSFSKNVTILSHKTLNNQIMANALENQGFNTWLTHLMTLRAKVIPFGSEIEGKQSNFFRLYEYAQCMTQEIYPIKFPTFFHNKKFGEVSRMLYFSQVNLSDQENPEEMDSADLIKHKYFIREFGILLIAVEQALKRDRNYLLINPSNYTIRRGDIGYFIAHTQEKVTKILSKVINDGGVSIQRFALINDQFEKEHFKENNKNFIRSLYQSLTNRNKNWQQNIPIYSLKKDNVFDLNMGDSLRGYFFNHVIIKGTLANLKNIITVIRFYSDRPILIFSEREVDYSKWKKIKETYPNVFYVRGIQHSLTHISELEPRQAYKILILTETTNSLFLDTDTIVFARILKDFFKIQQMLVELADESMIRFLEIKPKFNLLSEQKEMSFFWPSFVSGNIHYNSLLMSLAAKSLYNPNWIILFKELSNPRIYKQTKIGNSKVVKENSNVCMLKITKEVAATVPNYGKLQYLLMNHEPCIIALALLKKRKSNQANLTNIILDQIKKSETLEIIDKNKEKLFQTVNSIYGTKFFLTNPSYFTRLNPGDKVLVLGMDDMSQKINETTSKVGVSMIEKIRRNFESPKKKKKRTSVFSEAKKRAEIDFKFNLKNEIGEIISKMNTTMKNSLVCLDIFNDNEKKEFKIYKAIKKIP